MPRLILSIALIALLAACSKGDSVEPLIPQETDASEEMGGRASAPEERPRLGDRTQRSDVDAERARLTDDVRFNLKQPVYFGFDKYDIDADAGRQLRGKATILRDHESLTIRLEGHTDVRGSADYNLALGQRRASAARDYLVALGIDRGRISTVSHGEERPVRDGASEEDHQRNRRVETVIVGR